MSFNGAGVFTISTSGQPVVDETVISASVFNAFTADIATGLSTCVLKDGTQTLTANIPMAGFKLTGLGAGSSANDSVRFAQVVGTEWTTPAFSAGDYTGSASMTWTVAAGDVTTYAYTLSTKTMIVAFDIRTTTVGGTPETSLIIAIPGGKTSAKNMYGFAVAIDNGTRTTAFATVNAAGTTILIRRTDLINWTASADNTAVQGQIAFEIQ